MRAEAADRYRRLDPGNQAQLRAVLVKDLRSESGARFLEPQLRAQACLGFDPAELELRTPDFSAISELFDDPFATLLLLAYDECATVCGYRGNLPLYDLLGLAYRRFARDVIADEAHHYALFLEQVPLEFGPRLREAPALMRRILAAEGAPYAATFVLDRDDPIYSAQILKRAADPPSAHSSVAEARRDWGFLFS